MKAVWQIEMNRRDNYFWYMKSDGDITMIPAVALEFLTYEECEKYRKEHDFENRFHSQKMWRN